MCQSGLVTSAMRLARISLRAKPPGDPRQRSFPRTDAEEWVTQWPWNAAMDPMRSRRSGHPRRILK